MESLPTLSTVLAKLEALGISLPPGRVRLDRYGDSAELSEELLVLIRQGSKCAGTGLLWGIEADQDPMPQVGDIEVVIDHLNEPTLVTRITQVSVVPYGEVTAEYAAIEGEGDGSLDYWRRAHWAFFSRECQRIGREPSEDMLVVCSVFELLNIVPSPADSPFIRKEFNKTVIKRVCRPIALGYTSHCQMRT